MSKKGIQIVADVFSRMQQARQELLALGTTPSEAARTPQGQQDILLGHLLDKGKDAMKDEFMKLISDVKASR